MTFNFPLYFRLVLIQGGCLLAGYVLLVLLLPAQALSADPEVARRSLIASLGMITASFVTTWGLLAGVTGVLFLREQRRQWSEILDRHCDPEMDETPSTFSIFPTVDDFGGRPQTIRCPLPEKETAPVSLFRNDQEESDPRDRTLRSVPQTIRLHALSGKDPSPTT